MRIVARGASHRFAPLRAASRRLWRRASHSDAPPLLCSMPDRFTDEEIGQIMAFVSRKVAETTHTEEIITVEPHKIEFAVEAGKWYVRFAGQETNPIVNLVKSGTPNYEADLRAELKRFQGAGVCPCGTYHWQNGSYSRHMKLCSGVNPRKSAAPNKSVPPKKQKTASVVEVGATVLLRVIPSDFRSKVDSFMEELREKYDYFNADLVKQYDRTAHMKVNKSFSESIPVLYGTAFDSKCNVVFRLFFGEALVAEVEKEYDLDVEYVRERLIRTFKPSSSTVASHKVSLVKTVLDDSKLEELLGSKHYFHVEGCGDMFTENDIIPKQKDDDITPFLFIEKEYRKLGDDDDDARLRLFQGDLDAFDAYSLAECAHRRATVLCEQARLLRKQAELLDAESEILGDSAKGQCDAFNRSYTHLLPK